MPLSVPSPPTTNPLARIRADLGAEWRPPDACHFLRIKLPASCSPSGCGEIPLVLLAAYEEHGPIFAIRIFHAINVFMLGPEGNRFILVTDRDKFRWRDGSLGDLIPLIGDGLLTTDGEYHDRARRVMLPLFHRERIAAAAGIMSEEAERALEGWRAGTRVDLYDWTRHVAMRVAMRALFGFDPDRSGVDVAATFERGLPSTSASTSFRCCADREARSPACAASAAPDGIILARSPAGDGPARRARTSSAC